MKTFKVIVPTFFTLLLALVLATNFGNAQAQDTAQPDQNAPAETQPTQVQTDPTELQMDQVPAEPPVEQKPQFYRAKILEAKDTQNEQTGLQTQETKVVFSDGDLKNQQKTLNHGEYFQLTDQTRVKPGDFVVVVKVQGPEGDLFIIADKYRLNYILLASVALLVVTTLLAGFRGFAAFFGLAVSLATLMYYIVPQIMAGKDPIGVILSGTLVIAFSSIYMAHGFSKQTTMALVSTLVTLLVSVGISSILINLVQLTGLGSEEAYFLQVGADKAINLRGLLLGGMILGALGVLDDITTAQTAVVYELKKANAAYGFKQLYAGALRVGKEHITSLINTLVLAYAGASLPLFLLFQQNNDQPLWFILNSEVFAEEIIRALAGSFALVLAVPITTAIAAWYVSRPKAKTTK